MTASSSEKEEEDFFSFSEESIVTEERKVELSPLKEGCNRDENKQQQQQQQPMTLPDDGPHRSLGILKAPYIPLWIHSIVLAEFNDEQGHRALCVWPPGSLDNDEEKRLSLEMLPETNAVAVEEELSFGLRFRRTNKTGWFGSSVTDQHCLQGACLTWSMKCDKTTRKVKHYGIAVLSVLLWYDVLVFYCRMILDEAEYVASFKEMDNLGNSSGLRHLVVMETIKSVYERLKETLGVVSPEPNMALDISMGAHLEGELPRRYRMRTPSSRGVGIHGDASTVEALMGKNLNDIFDWPLDKSDGLKGNIKWPEITLFYDIPFADISKELNQILTALPGLWENIVCGKSVIVLGKTPPVVTTIVLMLIRMVGEIGYAGDFRPYLHSMSSDYHELIEFGRSMRKSSQKLEEKLNENVPYWIVETRKRLRSASQQMALSIGHQSSPSASTLDTIAAGIPGLQEYLNVKTIPLPTQIVIGLNNPFCLEHCKPFDCTLVVDYPNHSSAVPKETDDGYVPIVFRKKGLDKKRHSWVSTSQIPLLGAEGSNWILSELGNNTTGRALDPCFIAKIFEELSIKFLTPLEQHIRIMGKRARQKIKNNPLCTPVNRSAAADAHPLDEDFYNLFRVDEFLTAFNDYAILPPFQDVERTRLMEFYVNFLNSMSSRIAVHRISAKINNELRLMRLVILIKSPSSRINSSPEDTDMINNLIASNAYRQLNKRSKEIINQVKNEIFEHHS